MYETVKKMDIENLIIVPLKLNAVKVFLWIIMTLTVGIIM